MELIQNNPYRIAGILSNATERELQKQKTKIKAYAKVGKEIKSDYDFQILENISRTEDSVNKAFVKVEQNHDKVNYALFWFLNASPFDNAALEYLKNGNEDKAVDIWEKVTSDKAINAKNFSAFNNLGTYKLLSKNTSDIKAGITAKIRLIESDYFENFVHAVADETVIIDNQKQSESFVDELLTQFNNWYSSVETLHLFSGCNSSTQSYLLQKFTEEPILKIEYQIKSCKRKRKANKRDAYEFGLKLFTNTKKDLSLLKSLLGTSGLKYKAVSDQLANEILQCGIDYFNESQEHDSNDNYLEAAQKLTKIADFLAVGKLAKDRAKDSLATLAKMKDRDLLRALNLLTQLKKVYDDSARLLMARVEEHKAILGYGQSINWDKVDELIKMSIDRDEVIDLIIEAIPEKSVGKIQKSQNASQIREYKDLVTFVLSKLSSRRREKIEYLKYWETLEYWKTTISEKNLIEVRNKLEKIEKIGREPIEKRWETINEKIREAMNKEANDNKDSWGAVIWVIMVIVILWLLSILFQ